MNTAMNWIYSLVAAAIATASCLASLSYDSKQLDFHPAFQASNIVAEFVFANTGKTPVVIKSIKTSCGCITATSNKMFYAPGEKGKIQAVYQIGATPLGLVQKEILVETDDPSDSLESLKMRVFLPSSATLDPATLSWTINESPKPKVIKVHITDSKNTAILHVISANPQVTATLKTITPNKEYEISVTPSSTANAMKATLIIESNLLGSKKYLAADASVIPVPQPKTTPIPSL